MMDRLHKYYKYLYTHGFVQNIVLHRLFENSMLIVKKQNDEMSIICEIDRDTNNALVALNT
jgi:hypothetical protein